ncbi:MAG: hypothetical protein ACE5DX_03605 [Candidatus Dojkabacteria bacterium]
MILGKHSFSVVTATPIGFIALGLNEDGTWNTRASFRTRSSTQEADPK